jgi:hypothetical protein
VTNGNSIFQEIFAETAAASELFCSYLAMTARKAGKRKGKRHRVKCLKPLHSEEVSQRDHHEQRR